LKIQSSIDAIRNDVGSDPLASISASRLKTFLTCRLKFYYEKILGLKSPMTPSLHVGRAVHAGLQEFHKRVWREEDSSTDNIVRHYQEVYSTMEAEEPVEYGDHSREDSLSSGERVLKAYLDSEHARDPRRIMGVEVALRAENSGLAIPLTGILDLVRDGIVPVDFKTAATTPSSTMGAWLNEIQLVAYHILLKEATGEEPGQGELVHLVKLKTPKVIKEQLPPVEQTHLKRFRALVEAYKLGVQRGEYYPSPGMQCSWCSFRGKECAQWSGCVKTTNPIAAAA
jgi:putative RecB family exonuclease